MKKRVGKTTPLDTILVEKLIKMGLKGLESKEQETGPIVAMCENLRALGRVIKNRPQEGETSEGMKRRN